MEMQMFNIIPQEAEQDKLSSGQWVLNTKTHSVSNMPCPTPQNYPWYWFTFTSEEPPSEKESSEPLENSTGTPPPPGRDRSESMSAWRKRLIQPLLPPSLKTNQFKGHSVPPIILCPVADALFHPWKQYKNSLDLLARVTAFPLGSGLWPQQSGTMNSS